MYLRWLRLSLNALLISLVIWLAWDKLQFIFSNYTIVTDIGNWPYQQELTVDQVSAESVEPGLNLFNNKFTVRYRIKGSMRDDKGDHRGYRPVIRRFQITYRVNPILGSIPYTASADVLIVPIVSIEKDANYNGESVPFDIEVSQAIRTFKWGANDYNVRCGNQTCVFTVAQRK